MKLIMMLKLEKLQMLKESKDIVDNNGAVKENIPTAEAEEIIYEAPAQYAPHVTVHKPIEETIIMHNGGMSDGIIDNIIRNTMSQNTNNNGYEFNQNYSQTNNINNINMNIYNNQNFDINNFNNQINYQSNNNNRILLLLYINNFHLLGMSDLIDIFSL